MKMFTIGEMPKLKIFGGQECLTKLTAQLSKYERVVVFVDSFLATQDNIMAPVKEAVGEKLSGVFTGVVPRSPLDSVEKAAAFLTEKNADAAVVIGGGSAFVTGRAAVMLYAEKEDAHLLCTHKDKETGKTVSPRLMAPKIPIFAIPTTASSSVVKCGSAVLDEDANLRLQLFDPKVRAKAVFLCPEFLISTPESVFMNAVANSFATSIEGQLSNTADCISNAFHAQALKMFVKAFENPEEIAGEEARTQLMLACCLVGFGTDTSGFGLSVAVAHGINEFFPLRDGHINLAVLPACLRLNRESAAMEDIAQTMHVSAAPGEDIAEKIIEKLEQYKEKLGYPKTLRDMKLDEFYIPRIAQNVMHDFFIRYNPVKVTPEVVEKIITESL